MKNSLFIISKLCMLAFILLLAQGCQEDYEMIDPPMMTDYDDDLDEEVIMQKGLESYFVTQFGEGEMDGSSWEQALDVAGFRKLLSGSVDLSKSTIYMSQGKYVMSEESGLGVIVRKNVKAIKGGYSQFSEGTDVSARDIDAYVTVISGDVNGNKQADAGDCGLLLVKKGHIAIEGVTFQYGYVSEADASTTECGSGIYVSGGAGDTSIELTDCVIRDCTSAVTTSAKQGGPAVFVLSGQVRLNKVSLLDNTAVCFLFSLSGQVRLNKVNLLDNKAVGRGGAVRCSSKTAVVFMNGCLLKGNSHNGSWGNGIQMSEGHICINNTTLIDNMGTGAALNGGGSILLTNNTIIGNASDTHGAVRCETGAGGDTKFINNLLISENPSAPSFNLNGSNFEAFSKGYNVYQRVTGITMSASDTAYPNPVNGTLNEKGVYVWDLNQIGSVKGYATKQAVIEVAKSFNPVASPIADLGEVFVEWIGEDAFGIDQRGVTRNANKMQAGAYDAVLTN